MRHAWKSHPERFPTIGTEVFGIEPIDPSVDDLSDIDEEITPERAVHDAAKATLDALQEFFTSIGMPATLGQFGITEEHADQLLMGLKINRDESFGTFANLTLEDAREIYASGL